MIIRLFGVGEIDAFALLPTVGKLAVFKKNDTSIPLIDEVFIEKANGGIKIKSFKEKVLLNEVVYFENQIVFTTYTPGGIDKIAEKKGWVLENEGNEDDDN